MLDDAGFFSSKPALFMTDCALAEKNAIHEVWPESKQLLCIFHVLQVSSTYT